LLIIALWYKSATAIYKEYRDVLQSILSKKNGQAKGKDEIPLIDLLKNSLLSWGSLKPNTLIRLFRSVVPYETDKLLSETEKLSAEVVAKKVLKFSRVIELSKSGKNDERIIAANNMTKYSIYKVEKPIVRLLHDENFDVKCEAIIATGKMKESELFYHLVNLFQKPEYKDIVSAAMIKIGEAIVPELDHNFQKTEYDVSAQLKTVELVEKIGGQRSIDFLIKNLNHHNKVVSDRIILALGNLNYRAERNDASIVWQKLENEIKNYVSITSAILNIGQIHANKNLYKALENEQAEKKGKIFSHLSVLYDSQAVKLIEENLEANDKDASGFALEVADMVLSEMHKPMLLPLFESQFNFEIVSKYMLYFPTEKMSVADQLADIINSEYWVTGFYTKCCAIKMLSEIKEVPSSGILIANMVHPNTMMWQLANFYLFQKNSELFHREVNQNFPKVNGLKEFSEKVESYVSGENRLVYDKLLDLRNLPLFDEVPEESLIELAASIIDLNLVKGEFFKTEPEQTDFYIIMAGEIIDDSTGLSLSKNNVICPFLAKNETAVQYRIVSDEAKLIIVKMHFITNLFAQNIDFAKELVSELAVEKI